MGLFADYVPPSQPQVKYRVVGVARRTSALILTATDGAWVPGDRSGADVASFGREIEIEVERSGQTRAVFDRPPDLLRKDTGEQGDRNAAAPVTAATRGK